MVETPKDSCAIWRLRLPISCRNAALPASSLHRRLERNRIRRRDQQSVDGRFNQQAQSTDVRCYDRLSSPHGFDHGKRHTLLNRGQHEHIECRQHLGNVGARAEERHVPLEIESPTLGLEFCAEAAISNNEQSRRLTMSNERLKRPQQGPVVLLGFEATHDTEDQVLVR